MGTHAQSEVDRIGWATAMCYGLVIPCFLGFLFAKQNVVMRKVKTAVMHTTCDDEKVRVWLQGLESKQSFKDRVCATVADWASHRRQDAIDATSTSVHTTQQENMATPL